jgi:hypothetical protein
MSARVTSITLSPTNASVSFACDDKFVAAGVLHLLRNMKTTHSMDCSGVSEADKSGEVTFHCSFKLKSTSDRNGTSASNNNG